VYRHFDDFLIKNLLLLINWKMRHGAIVDNVVANLYAKFDDDRL